MYGSALRNLPICGSYTLPFMCINLVERMSYAAFGERRKGDWRASDPLLPIIPTLTNRGFTGHVGVFQRIVHYITVSIITLGIVRGLDIGISTEKSSNLWVIHSTVHV
jgi:hypothetical protein